MYSFFLTRWVVVYLNNTASRNGHRMASSCQFWFTSWMAPEQTPELNRGKTVLKLSQFKQFPEWHQNPQMMEAHHFWTMADVTPNMPALPRCDIGSLKTCWHHFWVMSDMPRVVLTLRRRLATQAQTRQVQGFLGSAGGGKACKPSLVNLNWSKSSWDFGSMLRSVPIPNSKNAALSLSKEA